MSQEQWGPDVREVVEENLRSCRHAQRGTCSRNVGAGRELIGCRRETYYGCLLCKKSLHGLKLAYLAFGPGQAVGRKAEGPEFEAWVDLELARKEGARSL